VTSDDRRRGGAGRLIADAMAEHEVERIGALSPEELAAEMENQGRDPARAKAIAASSFAVKHRGALRLIEDSIAEYEVERIGELSPEGLADEMKKEGRDPARAKAVAERALAAVDATAEPSGKVVSLEEKRKARWGVRVTLLLVAASFVGYAALGGVVGVSHPPPRTEGEERATDLRKEAFAACDEGQASVCKDKLDQAKALDPEGEQSSQVVEARARIRRLEASGAGNR